MEPDDMRLLALLQDGLPLDEEPFGPAARALGSTPDAVVDRLRALGAAGVVRRFGARLDQHRLGLEANAVIAWRVPPGQVGAAGAALAARPEVTHCYERSGVPGCWEYTLLHSRPRRGPCRRGSDRRRPGPDDRPRRTGRAHLLCPVSAPARRPARGASVIRFTQCLHGCGTVSHALRAGGDRSTLAYEAPYRPIVFWNLTRACNLACDHCYISAGPTPAQDGELCPAAALAVVDDLARAGVPLILLSGGEPLLRPDLMAIASRARDRGIATALSTNGTLIDAEVARQTDRVRGRLCRGLARRRDSGDP